MLSDIFGHTVILHDFEPSMVVADGLAIKLVLEDALAKDSSCTNSIIRKDTTLPRHHHDDIPSPQDVIDQFFIDTLNFI